MEIIENGVPDLAVMFVWPEPREVQTKRGPRLLRKIRPDPEFWSVIWARFQWHYKAHGFSASEDLRQKGKFDLCWWQPLEETELQKRSENKTLSRAADTDFAPPVPPRLEYFPYQKAGIRYALDKDACYIADEMGLGKTIQAIGVINTDETIERVLVLTKASLKENWRRELSKWLVDKMDIGIAEGQKWPRKADIVIANYDILGKHFHALREKPWDLIILDESQYLSEPKNKRTKAVIGFTPSKKKQEEGEAIIPPIPARRKIALSGTPIENNEIDIWPVLNYLAPHRFPSYWGFAFKFCGAVKQEWGGIAWTGEKKPAALQDLLRSTMMIRRLKRDVAKELPAKTRMVVELDTEGLDEVLSDDYKAWQKHGGSLEEAQADLELARAGDSEEAFRDRVRDMKEAKFAFDELALIRKKTALAKLPKVIPLLKDDVKETAGKCLIFAHHHEVIEQLRKEFPRSVCITGSTPAASRQAIVDRFQNDPRCGPFIGSIRACGEGLNLTAASVVDFVEEDWTPSKICQVEDRAHRIGQKDNVTVKHYIVPGTCDARMLQVTLAKQEMIERTIDLDPESWVAEPLLAPHDSLGKRKDLQEEGLLITSSEIHAIKAGLLILAMMCDGGVKVDGVGFSKVDAAIGRRLAHLPSLTGPQAALGRRLCIRYRKQLGESALLAMGYRPKEPDNIE